MSNWFGYNEYHFPSGNQCVQSNLKSNLFTTFCFIEQNSKMRKFLDDEFEGGEGENSERWSCGGSAILTNRDRTHNLKKYSKTIKIELILRRQRRLPERHRAPSWDTIHVINTSNQTDLFDNIHLLCKAQKVRKITSLMYQ